MYFLQSSWFYWLCLIIAMHYAAIKDEAKRGEICELCLFLYF